MAVSQHSSRGDRYTHGYSAAAVAEMRRRTATEHAAFFLPHLDPSMSVLDCGCGPGTITLGFAEIVSSGRATGIDVSESQVIDARKYAEAAGRSNATFQVGDIYDLPFEDGTFDAVFTNAVLEHLSEPESAVREIHRVLKPGGMIGARHSVFSSRVWSPPASEQLRRVDQLFAERWRENGGNPDFGLVQEQVIGAAGFEIIASATSAHRLGPCELRSRAEHGGEAGLMSALSDIGATKSEIPDLLAAYDLWMQNEDAFNSFTMAETVGRKQARQT